MTSRRDRLSKAETITIAAIEDAVPALVEARTLVAEFHTMLRDKDVTRLDPWLPRARSSLIASFARGVLNDQGAVREAISTSWSDGQTEGQITKLKLVKPDVRAWKAGSPAGQADRRIVMVPRTEIASEPLLCASAFQIGDDCGALGGIGNTYGHERARHYLARGGEEGVQRLAVPDYARLSHRGRIAGAFDAAGSAADDAGQMWACPVLARFQAVAGATALMEQPLAIGLLGRSGGRQQQAGGGQNRYQGRTRSLD